MTTELYDGTTPDQMIAKDGIFWFVAKNGTYLRRPTLLGNVIVPHTSPDLQEFPEKGGYLDYSLPKIPAAIVAQTHDWFKRVFTKWQCEAEVLITMNPDADNPFRLFIPIQHNSHGGVHSAYNPEHLARGWQVIGSIHSHCDFSAFHSGTDTNDASEFDGLHVTFGNVNNDKPSMDAMVVLNKVRWNMNVAEVLDTSELNQHPAPNFWDRYVISATPHPKLQATFDEYRPPKPPERKQWTNTWTKPTPKWTPAQPMGTGMVPYQQSYVWPDDDLIYNKDWNDYITDKYGDTGHPHDPDLPPWLSKYNHPKSDTHKTDDTNVNELIDKFGDALDALIRVGIYPIDICDDELLYGPDYMDFIDPPPADSPRHPDNIRAAGGDFPTISAEERNHLHGIR